MSTSAPSFRVWDCKRMLRVRCPCTWEQLDQTSNAEVRHCRECDRDVYRCRTVADFITHGEHGHCLAITDETSAHVHGPGLGMPSPEAVLIWKALADRRAALLDEALSQPTALGAERIEELRAERARLEEEADRYSPEHLAVLRIAVRDGGVRCARCGFDIASDEFGVMIFLQMRQCMVCRAPIELDLPSE
jgi:hypothetical protein